MKQNRIAITGGIGSGKSTVSAYLREKGYAVFDCDKIALELSQDEKFLEKIKAEFGEAYIENGVLNRKALAVFCFADKLRTEKLNAIFHGEIEAILINKMKSISDKLVFAEVPLLFESGMEKDFDSTWLVIADKNLRQQRVEKRSNLTEMEFSNRSARQIDVEEAKNKANIIIENNADTIALFNKIDNLLLQY